MNMGFPEKNVVAQRTVVSGYTWKVGGECCSERGHPKEQRVVDQQILTLELVHHTPDVQ